MSTFACVAHSKNVTFDPADGTETNFSTERTHTSRVRQLWAAAIPITNPYGKNIMHRVSIVVAGFALCGIVAVSSGADDAKKPKPAANLVLNVSNGGGFVGPSLKLSVSPDGSFKRWEPGPGGTLKGKISAAQLDAMKQRLVKEGVFDLKSAKEHPNAPYMNIAAAFDGKSVSVRVADGSPITNTIREIAAGLKAPDKASPTLPD